MSEKSVFIQVKGAPFSVSGGLLVLPSKGLENLGPDALIPQKNSCVFFIPIIQPDLPNASLEKNWLQPWGRQDSTKQWQAMNAAFPVCVKGKMPGRGPSQSPQSPNLRRSQLSVNHSGGAFGLNPNFHLPVLTQKLLQSQWAAQGKFTMLIPTLGILLVHTSSHLWPHTHTPMSLRFAEDLASESWGKSHPCCLTKPRDVFFSWNSVHTCYFLFCLFLVWGSLRKGRSMGHRLGWVVGIHSSLASHGTALGLRPDLGWKVSKFISRMPWGWGCR